ncbi:MAG: alpha/beta hydrolase family protein [Candidatus Kapaibacteriota bacterium]
MKKIIILLLLIPIYLYSQDNSLIGCWVGKIDILRQELAIKICFELDSTKNLTGKIDIPSQNAFNLNLTNIVQKKDSISFDLAINLMNIAKFDGKIFSPNTDKASISGSFRQMGMVGRFELDKYFVEPEEEVAFPAHEEEVEIQNNGIKLAGTFLRPIEHKKYPAIIFITGSGIQNRDEEIYGFKIFKKIAEALVKIGFATLRMDDRGIGGSTTTLGKSSTTFDFASDAEQMIKYLKGRDDVDTNHIGILGHSEGAIVAFIVASKDKSVDFVVSIAGPTIRGDSLILEQIKIQMKKQNSPDSLVAEVLQDQREIYDIIRKTHNYEKAKEILRKQAKRQMEYFPEEFSSQVSTTLIERNIQMQIESLRSEWFTTFINLDPISYLKQIQCPLLFVYAEKDQQVPPEINIKHLQKHIKKKNFTIKTISSANHLFQKCKTGQIYEYAILPKKFAPNFLETIQEWLYKNVLTKK